ncbi:MAG: protein of unknown function (DUF3199) [Namikivirus tsukuho]|uniref:Uncharacterized protein n=1 Tax=Bacteriophage sp. TaxID=38018 RepID=A0ABY5TRE8_9VIRU|nr:MAG: protein of unknown function (DUF3199) [Bacteriophage sp.]
MIIDDTIRDQVGDTVYDTWKDAALADLANMLCMSQLDETTDSQTGIVSDDGKHVILPAWYSEVTSVRSAYDTSLEYTIEYTKSDGLTPETKYANSLTLTTPYLPGMAATITGTHGFPRLPKPLTNILTAIIQADQSMTDRTDSITSKKIEDVSVSYATSTQTTLEHALTPYLALLGQWSLCHATNNGGLLSMPTPHHDLPWWMNEQDLGSNDYAIM